ncbi:MAG: DUF2169 domain-containing protein [Thermodesulfobacteriota bacterium]
MKIYKRNEHAPLVKTFGLKGRMHLALTVMVWFNLTAPDDPLTEQDLWGAVPDLLGDPPLLDQGLPKPGGEVVVTGKCFAPRGTTRPASRVSLQVGPVHKTLDVFGNRYWKGHGESLSGITAPEPFSEMPLTWENAFGGEGFEDNPVGKGLAPVTDQAGRQVRPLPNVEDPAHLIASPHDRPRPTGLAPLDMMWPQRAKKTGTYDDKWLKERWPWFPDDMNYEFFNVAPADQFLPGFFTGDETIEIRGMHPDLPVITSHLPPLIIRCFVTKRKSLDPSRRDETEFVEAKTHIDTLWLFPEVLRGLVMYRGGLEVLDDEFADIVRIFIVTERKGQEPKGLEYYREQQEKAADLTVPIDMSPFEKAQKKIAAALKKFKSLPKDIEAAKKRALGQAPVMSYSPADMAALKEVMIKDQLALVDRLETMARSMHAQYGHLVEIDLGLFDRVRGKVRAASERVDAAVGKLEAARQKGEAVRRQVAQALKENVAPEILAEKGIDPDNLSLDREVTPWHDAGFPLVVRWRQDLDLDGEAKAKLAGLGLSGRTVRRHWLGLCRQPVAVNPADWGLTDLPPFQIPAGLVLPRFRGATLNRILVRPGPWEEQERDFLVPGSDETPLALLAEVGAPVVRVSTELEALLLDQEAGDACSVIALETPQEKPGDQAAAALKAASLFLVVLPEKPAGPEDRIEAWTKLHPQARPVVLPQGRNLFEAAQAGADPRSLILEALPEETRRKHQVEPLLPEPGQPPAGSPLAGLALPLPDIKGLVEKLMQEIRDGLAPRFDKVKALQQQAEDQARKALSQAGLDPDAHFAALKNRPKKSLAEMGDDLARQINEQQEQLRAKGLLTSEAEQKMSAAAATVQKMGREGDARLKAGLAQLDAGRKKAMEAKAQARAGEPPEAAKKKLLAAGLDPDKIKRRTREEVISMRGRGESLAGAILSGLDLSGLDLAGIDLTGAQLRKTNLSGCNLAGARLDRVLAQEADLSKAVLKNASARQAILIKAKMDGADLAGADLHQAVMTGADLTGADFTGAKLSWTILQRAKLEQAKFTQVQGDMAVFTRARAAGADFSGSRLFKCLFQKTDLDRANFSGAVLDSSLMQDARGQGVIFKGADLTRFRTGTGTALPGADFRGSVLDEACLRESNLAGADFTGAVLKGSLLEACDLSRAKLARVPARRCRFNKSNLEGADLRAADLFLSSLRKARLVEADLTASNLYGVDFYKAVLGRTRFDRANLKMTQLHHRTEVLK